MGLNRGARSETYFIHFCNLTSVSLRFRALSPCALQGYGRWLFRLLVVPLACFFEETEGLSRATISSLVESWNSASC
jgi:hypothetical protein